MPKGVCKGCPEGKSAARRHLPMKTATRTAIPTLPRDPIPERPRSPPPKDPSPPHLWKEEDSFSTVLNDLSGWKRSRITPRKRGRLYYAAIYCNDLPRLEPEERDSDDDAANVLKRCGIEGASEMLNKVPV